MIQLLNEVSLNLFEIKALRWMMKYNFPTQKFNNVIWRSMIFMNLGSLNDFQASLVNKYRVYEVYKKYKLVNK